MISNKQQTTHHRSLTTIHIVLLFIFGCGDETINAPLGGTRETEDPVPVIYYPMTVGSKWVYRNAGGSEWWREVTETEEVGSHLYHFFGYDSQIGNDLSVASENPIYAPTPYAITFDGRLIYDIKLSDVNDAVQQTISQSGRVPPNQWTLGVRCRTEGERAVAKCRMRRTGKYIS